MLVLTWGGNRYAWLSPAIMAMIGASIALALAFVWHARNAEEPFLPLPLMGGTVVPYAMAAGGCALGAITGLTVHLPLYYEVVYHLSASEAGLALIPLAAVSTCGAAIAGRTMARAKHYKRVAIAGTSLAAISGIALTLTTLPLWGLLVLLSLFALGLGTTFPVSVVSLQNSVARAQIGTVTGAMNFFRALMSSFTVAAFSAILLMALGADISLGEHRGPVECDPGCRHDHGVPLRVRRRHRAAGQRRALHDRDGRTAAGRPLDAGGDGGVGVPARLFQLQPATSASPSSGPRPRTSVSLLVMNSSSTGMPSLVF